MPQSTGSVMVPRRHYTYPGQWRIQNFIMGAEGRGEGSGGSCAPSPEKNEFLPENGGFWCILGLLFTFMQKLVRSMGGGHTPSPPGSATVPIVASRRNFHWLGLAPRPRTLVSWPQPRSRVMCLGLPGTSRHLNFKRYCIRSL